MDTFPTDIDGQVLTRLVEALTDSGQAISIYDADDQLRYANTTYRDIFLGDYEGPYTFADILRYGAKHGLGVRIDGGDVEALIARTYTRRRNTSASRSRPIFSMGAGSGWTRRPCRTDGS